MAAILVVEDDEQLGAQIVETLSGEGHQTVWKQDGTAALGEDPSAYRLIILDLMLPGTYGLDVLKRIREESIEFIDLKFVDLFGGLQHISFPASALDEAAEQLDLLSRSDVWWIRLYVAETFRDEPRLAVAEIAARLREDEHPLVRQTAGR